MIVERTPCFKIDWFVLKHNENSNDYSIVDYIQGSQLSWFAQGVLYDHKSQDENLALNLIWQIEKTCQKLPIMKLCTYTLCLLFIAIFCDYVATYR